MKCIICNSDHDGSYGKTGKYCSKKCRYTYTEERNEKISVALTGVKRAPFSEDTKRRMSASKLGVKLTPFTKEHKEKISDALMGINRPYQEKENNPNYGGKYTHDPMVYKKMCKAMKIRGQSWDENLKLQHSLRMKGESNWMRGKHHTEETKQKIREKMLSDFASGRRKLNKTMVSLPEKEIAKLLSDMGYNVKMGFRISNNLYDMFVPEKNLIIEFNGDYWHMNPSKYSSNSYNKACGMTADEIWKRDKNKMENVVNRGYKFCCIWENDYKKSNNKPEFLRKVIS